MKKPKAKRTAAQAAAGKKFAAAGRAAQARKRAYNKAHGLPTRTSKQTQASQKWAAAGRASQARKRAHLKPLPKKKRALASAGAGVGIGEGVAAGGVVDVGAGVSICADVGVDVTVAAGDAWMPELYQAGAGGGAGEDYGTCEGDDVGEFRALYQPGEACTATAVANHLLMFCGIAASQAEITAVHELAGGDISDVLELLSVRGLAGTRIRSFWPVAGLDEHPGFVAGLRLPQGAHAVLTLGGGACASWGSTWKMAGVCEESWWIDWCSSGTG